MKRLLLLLLVSLCSFYSCHAKRTTESFKLDGAKTEATLTKFAISPNAEGKITLKLTSDKEYMGASENLKVYLYNDEVWEKVKKTPMCTEKIAFASKKLDVQFTNLNERIKQQNAIRKNKWRSTITSAVGDESAERPQYWYVTVADCSLEVYFHDNRIPEIDYDIKIMDFRKGEYSHLSYDEVGLARIHFLNCVLSGILGLYVFYVLIKRLRSKSEVHLSLMLVLYSTILHTLSSICEVLHLLVYSMNGKGSYMCDALAGYFEAIMDSVMSFLLLAVAAGWTLPSELSVASIDNNKVLKMMQSLRFGWSSTSNSFIESLKNPTFLIGTSLTIIHLALCQWGRIYDDDFDSYHDLEHLPGKILSYFRILMCIAFTISCASLRKYCHSNRSLKAFLIKFTAVGASWFIYLPALAAFIHTLNISYHRRHPIMTVCSEALHFISLASLVWMFCGEEGASAFHRVSSVNGNVGMIGGGGLTGAGAGGSNRETFFRIGKAKIRVD